MRVAYPGAAGAFSHEACQQLLSDHDPVPFPSFAEVISAVSSGEVELGMLPLANNEAGETGARQLIREAGLQIASEAMLTVRMHLLGTPGSTVEQISTVVSHPVALSQCARTIARLGVGIEESSNTALAARDLRDPTRAVLASEAAASIYGLAILERDVHDRPDNATTFAIIARDRP